MYLYRADRTHHAPPPQTGVTPRARPRQQQQNRIFDCNSAKTLHIFSASFLVLKHP
jgi:hypothetical protein